MLDAEAGDETPRVLQELGRSMWILLFGVATLTASEYDDPPSRYVSSHRFDARPERGPEISLDDVHDVRVLCVEKTGVRTCWL